MHFRQAGTHGLPQPLGKIHRFPAAGLAVVQRPLRDVTAQHFLQTDGLRTQLQPVGIDGLRSAPLVFHRVGLPAALPAGNGHPIGRAQKFDGITLAGNPQPGGMNVHPPGDFSLSPAFPVGGIVDVFMHDGAVGSTVVFRPQVFYMDKRPLPAAKDKMLQAR